MDSSDTIENPCAPSALRATNLSCANDVTQAAIAELGEWKLAGLSRHNGCRTIHSARTTKTNGISEAEGQRLIPHVSFYTGIN